MNPYQIMHDWDREAGIPPRSDGDLDLDVPACLRGDYEDWKQRLAEDDVDAILEGRKAWGLPPFV